MSPGKDRLDVSPIGSDDHAAWAAFLAASENGTLFHDLDFLAYHPPGRHRFEHLIVRRGDAIVALLPGGLTGPADRPIFTSPLGASVGGPAVAPDLGAGEALELVEALQVYAQARRWAGLEFTLAPSVYQRPASDLLPFALFCGGFELRHRWLCYMLPLAPDGSDRYRSLFRERVATFVRAGKRRGIAVAEGGAEQLGGFLAVFRDTYARHGTAPTHTPEEIAELLRCLPQRIRLYVATLGDVPVAGSLVMLLNARVAYSFYICMSTAHAQERGNSIVFATLLDRLAEQGYSWLDLGPGSSDRNYNPGVAFFKESLGAVGQCRDRWCWSVPGKPALTSAGK